MYLNKGIKFPNEQHMKVKPGHEMYLNINYLLFAKDLC